MGHGITGGRWQQECRDSRGETQPARPNSCPEHPRGNRGQFSAQRQPPHIQHRLHPTAAPHTVPALSPARWDTARPYHEGEALGRGGAVAGGAVLDAHLHPRVVDLARAGVSDFTHDPKRHGEETSSALALKYSLCAVGEDQPQNQDRSGTTQRSQMPTGSLKKHSGGYRLLPAPRRVPPASSGSSPRPRAIVPSRSSSLWQCHVFSVGTGSV